METKQCPRCKNPFICNPENISDCQCSRIQLTSAESNFLKTHFADCLCIDCLQALKLEYKTHENNRTLLD